MTNPTFEQIDRSHPAFELITLAVVLGVSIASAERDQKNKPLTDRLLFSCGKLRECGVTTDALDALVSGLRIGGEPSPNPDGGISEKVVSLFRNAA